MMTMANTKQTKADSTRKEIRQLLEQIQEAREAIVEKVAAV